MAEEMDRVMSIVDQLSEVVYTTGRELPRIHRNFKQLMEEGEELWNRHASTEATEAEGIAFLGSRGLDMVAAKRMLDKIQTEPEKWKPEDIDSFDIPKLMERAKESIVMDLIKTVQDDVDDYCTESFWQDNYLRFQDFKDQMMEAGGDELLPEESFVKAPVGYAVAVSPLHLPQHGQGLDGDQRRFVQRLIQHNKEVITGNPKSDLLNKFMDVADEMKSETARNRWSLLLQFKPLAAGAVGQGDVAVYRAMSSTIDEYIRLSRSFLEDKYMTHVEKSIYANMNLRSVEVTTRPGRFELIRNYWRSVVLPTLHGFYDTPDNLAAGVPAWAFLFYAIRSGDLDVAMEVVDTAGLGLAEVKKYLEEMRSNKYRRVNPESQAVIRMAYRGGICQSMDIYKKIVYCILGACDFEDNHEYVCVTTDDYLWVKLCHLRGDKEPTASGKPLSSCTFFDFQKKMAVDFGESHFKASKFPDLYFMVLVLSGQMEKAFEFFFRVEGIYKVDGFHMALAMFDIGLLNVTKLTKEQMLVESDEFPPGTARLNLGRMLITYTKAFYRSDPVEALHYYYRLLGFKYRGDDAFQRLAAEMILDIGNAEYFFGRLSTNWTRMPGAMDEFRQDTNEMIKRVAEGLLERKAVRDAVNMLLLCGEDDRAVLMLVTELASLASLNPDTLGPRVVIREQLVKQAEELVQFMGERGSRGVARATCDALVVMLNIVNVYELFYKVQMKDALDNLEKLGILPFDVSRVDRCAAGYKHLHPQIRRAVPELMVAAMQILFQLHTAARSGDGEVRSISIGVKNADQYHKKASAVIAFGGLMAEHISGDTMVELMQVASMM